MSEQQKQVYIWPAVLATASIIAAVVIFAALKQRPKEQTNTDIHHEHSFEPLVEGTNESAKIDTPPTASSKIRRILDRQNSTGFHAD